MVLEREGGMSNVLLEFLVFRFPQFNPADLTKFPFYNRAALLIALFIAGILLLIFLRVIMGANNVHSGYTRGDGSHMFHLKGIGIGFLMIVGILVLVSGGANALLRYFHAG
jgi:hypothetical protein